MEKIMEQLYKMNSVCVKTICEECRIKKACDKFCGNNSPRELINKLNDLKEIEDIERIIY